MSHQTLKSFIDLVTFDQQRIDIQKQIIQNQKDLAKNDQQMDAIKHQVEQYQHKKQETQKALQTQEHVVASLQDQEQSLLQSVEKLHSSKEYDAAAKQLEHVRLNRSSQEQKLIQMMNRTSATIKDIDAQIEAAQGSLNALEQIQQQVHQQHAALEAQLVQLDGQRSEKLVGVPVDWLETYDLMQGRVADPVVPLQQESCSACFYSVTPRDLQLIKSKTMIQCKECYRFLYEASQA